MNIDWLKAIQLKARYLFGLFLFGFLFLFLPNNLAEDLGIKIIRDEFKGWIGVGTLAALCFWLVALIPIVEKKWKFYFQKKEILESLRSLNREEHQILSYCLRRGQRSINLDLIWQPWHTTLCQKGLLVQTAGYGDQQNWGFTIPDFVWDELREIQDEFLEKYDCPDELPRNRYF